MSDDDVRYEWTFGNHNADDCPDCRRARRAALQPTIDRLNAVVRDALEGIATVYDSVDVTQIEWKELPSTKSGGLPATATGEEGEGVCPTPHPTPSTRSVRDA